MSLESNIGQAGREPLRRALPREVVLFLKQPHKPNLRPFRVSARERVNLAVVRLEANLSPRPPTHSLSDTEFGYTGDSKSIDTVSGDEIQPRSASDLTPRPQIAPEPYWYSEVTEQSRQTAS